MFILEFGGIGSEAQSTIKIAITPDNQASFSYELEENEPFTLDVQSNNDVQGIYTSRFTYFFVSLNNLNVNVIIFCFKN